MRTIKFKAYAKQPNKHGQLKLRVFDVPYLDLEEKRIIAVGKGGGRYEFFFHQLEGLAQWTGLHDQDGKKHYFDDIVNVYYGGRLDETRVISDVFQLVDLVDMIQELGATFEIIGNIHQHPDLLSHV